MKRRRPVKGLPTPASQRARARERRTKALDALSQQPGESNSAWASRVARSIRGDDVTSRGDLRAWTGSPPFHLNREPSK